MDKRVRLIKIAPAEVELLELCFGKADLGAEALELGGVLGGFGGIEEGGELFNFCFEFENFAL